MVYNLFFYDKVPFEYDPDKTPESEAEELAIRTMKIALSDNPGPMTPDDAVEALTGAADLGFVPALYWCGWLYQYQPYIFLRTWYYGRPGCALMHYRKAENFYLKAIRAGDMNAHYGLSTLYIFGNYDNTDHYPDGHPGINLSEGLYHMRKAAASGVAKAAEGLSLFFANKIYNSEEELQNYLHGIKVNKYRNQSGLRHGENGELVFDPDALGCVNFECIRDDELSRYWGERISDPQSKEPPHIIELTEQAKARLKEYEETYLAGMKSSLAYDREKYKELRQDDSEIRWKRQMDEEMHQRIKELPPKFHAAIYDEYAEKRKRFLERTGVKQMKNAIGITVTKAPEKYDLGASKFFGTPTVPAAWTDKFDDNEIFFCQICLSDIAELDHDNKLPHTGYLYIFLDISSFPYKARVLHYDGEPDTAIDDFNAEIPGAENLCNAWLMSFAEVEDDAEGIKLFGTPADWCYGEDVPRILMQYDPLASDMGFADSIDGYAYFAFAEDSDKLEDVTYFEERS